MVTVPNITEILPEVLGKGHAAGPQGEDDENGRLLNDDSRSFCVMHILYSECCMH